jgi:transposase
MQSIAKTFSINIKTLYLWRKQRNERGFIHGITNYQKGHSHKILDIIAFKEFVDKHLNLSTAEMAKELNVSISTVARTMRKTNFARKKKLGSPV